MLKIRDYLYLLRPNQWIKNLFVLLPLLFSGLFVDRSMLTMSAVSFLTFCLLASGVYTLNDIIDLEHDRQHPTKKLRPLAAGKLNLAVVAIIGVTLTLLSLCIAYLIGLKFFSALLAYLLLNVFYTFWLKHIVIIDVFCIAAFFIFRVLAGAFAINVEVSHWIILCTGLLSLFIGFNKRRHEIKLLGKIKGGHRKVLEDYTPYFIDQMSAIITSSTAVFYTLYAIDDRTVQNIGSYSMLYTVPFVYYGIFRYLYVVHLTGKGGDPSRIVLSDKKLLINILLWMMTSFLVIQGIL